MCLIALEMMELFKISECWHWVPKNDIWALKIISSLSPSFLHQFFSFFAHYGMGVGLQMCAFHSHTKMVVIPSVSPASWQCHAPNRFGTVNMEENIYIK